MRIPGSVCGLAVGLGFGFLAAWVFLSGPRFVVASGHDRYQDFVMATGAVGVNPRVPMDGVWMLDYRSGKLLGTVIDKTQGKIAGWAEVDLVTQFEVAPKQDVHFMMVTGWVSQGQSALYVAETNTGKFGVFTMSGGPNGTGVVIKQHDMTSFRKTAPPAAPTAPASPAAPTPAPINSPQVNARGTDD